MALLSGRHLNNTSAFHCGSWRGFRGPAVGPQGPRLGPRTHKRAREEGGRRREGPLSFSSFKSVSLAAFIGVILPRLWVLVLDACPWRRRRGRRTIQNSHGGTKIIGTAGSGRRLREEAPRRRCVWTSPSSWHDHQTASICPVWFSPVQSGPVRSDLVQSGPGSPASSANELESVAGQSGSMTQVALE